MHVTVDVFRRAIGQVFASTLLLSGSVQLQIQKTGQQTVAARIGEILQKTSHYKNRHEYLADQFV